MDLRKRNVAELEIASVLTKNIADKIDKGMTLLGTFVGGINKKSRVNSPPLRWLEYKRLEGKRV